MDILDDMEMSKLLAKVFSKVNYSFKRVIFKSKESSFQPIRFKGIVYPKFVGFYSQININQQT